MLLEAPAEADARRGCLMANSTYPGFLVASWRGR